ncbi:MAG: S1 family peptidase, partial [Candidatus Rokuibacteriota bacterium]
SSGGSLCTLNFVFFQDVDGDNLRDPGETLYIGTAAHCVNSNGEATGQRMHVRNVGAFGTVIYNGWEHGVGSPVAGDPRDVALIRIDADKESLVQATLRFWGGPSAVASTNPGFGQRTLHYGHGLAFGDTEATRPREGLLVFWSETGNWQAEHPIIFGDSGSAILTADGKALGIVTFLSIGFTISGGPSMARIMSDLAANGHADKKLYTSVFRPLTDTTPGNRIERLREHCSTIPGLLDANTGCVTFEFE